jgi:hypothetical protein
MSHFINWEELEILEKEAKRISKSNGRPWGGARQGAGRPKKRVEGLTVEIKLNNIQTMNLRELGDGDIKLGVQRLIDLHM